MPLYKLFEGQAFEPEHCEAMGAAFEAILQELRLKDRNDPLCEMIARKVIALGQQGIREPQQLRERVLKDLGPSVSS